MIVEALLLVRQAGQNGNGEAVLSGVVRGAFGVEQFPVIIGPPLFTYFALRDAPYDFASRLKIQFATSESGDPFSEGEVDETPEDVSFTASPDRPTVFGASFPVPSLTIERPGDIWLRLAFDDVVIAATLLEFRAAES